MNAPLDLGAERCRWCGLPVRAGELAALWRGDDHAGRYHLDLATCVARLKEELRKR